MDRIDGRYLRELREERGLSLRAFAEKIYVSKSTVQRWEQSVVPENTDILNKISEVFGISVEDMREQSAKKYGVEHVKDMVAEEDDGLTPDQRAEAKFGIKGLGTAAMIICGVALVAMVIPLIILVACAF